MRGDEQGIMRSTLNTLTSKVLVVGYRLEASEAIGWGGRKKKGFKKEKGMNEVRKDEVRSWGSV